MNQRPRIPVEATFLPFEEGGRVQVPDLNAGCYMPHLVIQSQDVRKAVVVDGNVLVEDYLGVSFDAGPPDYLAGQSGQFLLELMYYPELRYEGLEEGATFTIREGAKVIGYGSVLPRPETVR